MYHRRSIRLPGFDYSQNGYYFVTICVQNREMMLGQIDHGNMIFSALGQQIHSDWLWLFNRYVYVKYDEYIIMPNHIHTIMIIDHCRGGSRTAPTPQHTIKPIGRIIGAFKTISTKHVHDEKLLQQPRLWQRNYYEHIIRNEREYFAIRKYIQDNPKNWEQDELYDLNTTIDKGEKVS